MASANKSKSSIKPKPLLELMPELSGILSSNAVVTLTDMKKPRTTMAQTRTVEKVYKPLNLAEMKASLLSITSALTQNSPRRVVQGMPSGKKKGWNSSVKVDSKKISHTASGHLKDNPVRKVLNFQSKPKPVPKGQKTTVETPKFRKPELRDKRSHHFQAKSSVRISGICNIPQTPVETSQPIRSKMTIENKENSFSQQNFTIKPTPKSKLATPKMVTPIYSSSCGSDESFLQKEKEIHEVEEKFEAMLAEPTLENIAEVSPPVSTPFKDYRSVQEYFNNSSCIENSVIGNDDTIMCFDKPSTSLDNNKREESVIVSLCDLFNKASVANAEKCSTEWEKLLEVKKKTEDDLEMIEIGICVLTKIKEGQEKYLRDVKKLIAEKKNDKKLNEIDKDHILAEKVNKQVRTLNPEKSPILGTVIKSARSPTYKVLKMNRCLRQKVICKSMPNVSTGMQTPVKDFDGKARSVYMKMKEQMNFLSTPMVNRDMHVPDTPAVTSHNLQKQLDKLYRS